MSQPSSVSVETGPPVPPPKDSVEGVKKTTWYLRFDQVQIVRSSHRLGVCFDCSTNIPSFHRATYHKVERSYEELAYFAMALSMTGPSVIVPPLPLPTPLMLHMPNVESDRDDVYELDELRILVSDWFDRISDEIPLKMHREMLRFIEADYSYEPLPLQDTSPSGLVRQAAKSSAYIKSLGHVWDGSLFSDKEEDTSSSSGMLSFFGRKATTKETPAALVPPLLASASSISVHDPDEVLSAARGEITKLEKQLSAAVSACAHVTKAQQGVQTAMKDLAEKLPGFATMEEARVISSRGQLPRTLRGAEALLSSLAQLSEQMAYADQITLGDAMEYQELNLSVVRQTLQARTAIVVEHALAQRVIASKRQDADQLRLAKSIRTDRVDTAIEEVREAQHHAGLLEQHLKQVTSSLRDSLQRHSVHTHHDLQRMMEEHARVSQALDKRIARILDLFDMEESATAAEVQRVAMEAAKTRRTITPAQIAAARIAGRPVEEQPSMEAPDSSTDDEAAATTPTTAAADLPSEEVTTTDPDAITAADTAAGMPPPIDAVPEPVPEPSFASQLFNRSSTGGRWGRLSASDAAKSLAGTF